jgi:hypothetical protein
MPGIENAALFPWNGQLAVIKGVENSIGARFDFKDMWMHDLLGNISCFNHLFRYILRTLECIGLVLSGSPTFEEMNEAVMKSVDFDEISKASSIVRNAFVLGWEHTLLAIVRDFAEEVLMRKPIFHLKMHSFLLRVEGEIHTAQQKEEDVNSTAVMALYRLGIDVEIIRMIIPGKVRFMGVPLALMPEYFVREVV